jgi:hypothetical protein
VGYAPNSVSLLISPNTGKIDGFTRH